MADQTPNELPSVNENVYEEDDVKFDIKTAEDFKTVQEVKMKWHILKKLTYVIIFFALFFAGVVTYTLLTNPEKAELIMHGITNITQIITVISQAVFTPGS